MKQEYEAESQNLQVQLDEKRATSADYDNEIAYAQQQATDYANLLAEQTAELQRLEAERIAAEEEARRQAEAEAAARAQAEAEEEARRQAEAEEQQAEEDQSEDVQYDENGDVIENTDEDTAEDDDEYVEGDTDDSEDDGVQYDEDGNVISDNTDEAEDKTDADSDNGDYSEADTSEDTSSSESESSSSSYSSGSGSSVVNYATQFVGNPYVWGGTSLTNGADCSGFVQSVYANFGVSLPRTSYEQQNAGTEVSYADAQPGDLICYGGHVAIYMGNGQIVHASNSQDGIKVSNDATYRTIVSVRRLV